MNKMIKYRQDYQPSHFLIDKINLTIELGEDQTTVTSTLTVRVNPENPGKNLILMGENQKLVSVKINNELLSNAQFKLTDTSLTLLDVGGEFDVELVSLIEPQNNTELMGLYKTGGNFCTQCEAEGFRKITYYLDRPDVMAVFTTKIIADKTQYPVLLSNGNLLESGELDNHRHFAVWHDPFKKPCYLFAMVAGKLAKLEDHFITMNKKKVTLQIFAAESVIEQCHFAMQAVKKSMRWDEEVYGREYDLAIFMIVAVNDFNFGAMENKGLNIFNDKYILADERTASDDDYADIDKVVAHEYFHNWSGDRVTLRDWFQLSLKEGFTVFREESFSESVALAEVDRIQQVRRLRSLQFPEDAGPLAHPVRPDSYIEMNNFYTMTVYEKGAELIRMLRTILGPETYRKATDLYFARNDGHAVTCDDFIQAMEDASGKDLTQFKLWYSQAGTPLLTVQSHYDVDKKQFHLTVKQMCPDTPGQKNKKPMHIPLVIGLLDKQGQNIHLPDPLLNLHHETESFVFNDITEAPTLSLLRGFSAPVKMNYPYTEEALAFLMAHDSDGVARWEAGQKLAVSVLLKLIHEVRANQPLSTPQLFLNALNELLTSKIINKALVAEMLSLPDEIYLGELLEEIDVHAIVQARKHLKKLMAQTLQPIFLAIYRDNQLTGNYQYRVEDVACRTLKNTCLSYLALLETKEVFELCYTQFTKANNMTDQFAALEILASTSSVYRERALDAFYQQWQDHHLVLDKWFATQAFADRPSVLDDVKRLLTHPAFNVKNPNKVRAVLGALTRNFSQFHRPDGASYELIAAYVLILDEINPMAASRLAASFSSWKNYAEPHRDLMKNELEKIAASKKLSPDVFEIVSKSLELAV